MAGLLSDVRGAWRLWSRHRATAVLIAVTLALGLGANAAVFAIARGVMLRPLPYRDPDRLVFLWQRREPAGPVGTGRGFATPRWFHEIRDRQRSFSSLAAIELWDGNPSATFDLAASGGGERLRGAFVTPNFFDTIGVDATIGRTFAPDDGPDVAVIGYNLWQRLFGGTPGVIGQHVELASGRGRQRAVRSITVIGVLPPRVQFSYPRSTDVWLPLTPQLESARPLDGLLYQIVARLAPATTLRQAHDDVAAAKAAMAAELNQNLDRLTFWLEPVHENAVGAARPGLRLLVGVSALVFLIASLNVATLLLVQTAERRRDLALQLALGASRWRIARQLLTESGLMAVAAATVSVAAVALLQPALRAAMPPGIPRAGEIGVDLFTLAWVTLLITLAVVLSTSIPAWRGSALDPGADLTAGSRTATPARAAALWRHALVAAQVAAVVVLVAGGGLLLRSFSNLQRVDLGFDGTRVFTAEMRLLDPRYFEEPALQSFQSELLARVRALPGVERASITSSVPLRGVDWMNGLTHRGERLLVRRRDVDPEYFAVMGIPLVAGRPFTGADGAGAGPTAIVSQTLATRLFPGENPLGRMLELGRTERREIVGVVGDVHNLRVDAEGEPAYYVPRAQESSELVCLVARTAPGTPDLAPAVRAIVAAMDPMQPVMNATTVADIVAGSIADRRLYALATMAFAALTLGLAAAGLFGVAAYVVVARTREIGVRVALGAGPHRVIGMLVLQQARPVAAGAVLGVIGALWAGRLLDRFLFGVRASDPAIALVAVVSVLTLTGIACLWPAARAARMSPIVCLRHE